MSHHQTRLRLAHLDPPRAYRLLPVSVIRLGRAGIASCRAILAEADNGPRLR